MSPKIVHLWVREHDGEAKAIEAGAVPPRAGTVVRVVAPDAKTAREVLEVAAREVLAPADLPPDMPHAEQDQAVRAWAEVAAAQRRVRRVARYEDVPAHEDKATGAWVPHGVRAVGEEA